MYEIKKDYRDNAALRQSFNQLAIETFSLNFEDWYQNGLWSDHYNPYSVVKDSEVIANVSVNQTDFIFGGNRKHFLQLGTVMTRTAYRKQGLIREIMAAIDADFSGKNDGVYLFANDSVLEFYPKFGFEKAPEYQYSKKLPNPGLSNNDCLLEQIPMHTAQDRAALTAAMDRNVFRGRLDMVDNCGLILFYITKFMQDNVYYHKYSDTYIIAEYDRETLFLHNVFSGTLHRLDEVTKLFGRGVKKVVLGFTPEEADGYEAEELHEEDCTFFIRGGGLDIFRMEKLRIPSLSHA